MRVRRDLVCNSHSLPPIFRVTYFSKDLFVDHLSRLTIAFGKQLAQAFQQFTTDTTTLDTMGGGKKSKADDEIQLSK